MTNVLRNLKLWQKFTALAIICTLMVGLPFYITYSAETLAIEGARSEAAGIAPVKAALQLMQEVTQRTATRRARCWKATRAPNRRARRLHRRSSRTSTPWPQA
jgi:hypothetical protein